MPDNPFRYHSFWQYYSGTIREPALETAIQEPEEGNMLNNFRVGCDPEFLLLDPVYKTILPAKNWFPRNGIVGYDHGGSVAEFRPAPAKGILPIIKKIQGLVQEPPLARIVANLRSGAYYNGHALGGHIHFGFKAFDAEVPYKHGTNQGYCMNERGEKTAKALDALTKALEHLDILPKNECAQRRQQRDGYGRFGDVRNCNGHMEYRTMASWLYDPRVAFLCLTAAKIAAFDPEGSYQALKGCDSFAAFKRWLEGYAVDLNVKRASEKLLDKGLASLQVDPTMDFKERWRELGL